jgi:DNA processing protein
MIPKVGSINAKKLIAYCGGVEEVFKQSKKALLKIPGVGECLATEIINQNILSKAEQEVDFIEKYNIKALFYLDADYPERLRQDRKSVV